MVGSPSQIVFWLQFILNSKTMCHCILEQKPEVRHNFCSVILSTPIEFTANFSSQVVSKDLGSWPCLSFVLEIDRLIQVKYEIYFLYCLPCTSSLQKNLFGQLKQFDG